MAGNTFPGLFSDITRIDQVRKALAQVLPGSLRQSAINPNQRASRRGHGYASSAMPTTAPVFLLRGRFFEILNALFTLACHSFRVPMSARVEQ
jgi:hypothetical protein